MLEILVEDGMLAPEHRKLIKGHGWDYYVPLRDYDYNYRDQKGEPVAFDAADVYDFIDDSAGPAPLRKCCTKPKDVSQSPAIRSLKW